MTVYSVISSTDKTVCLVIGLYKTVVEIPKIFVTVGANKNNKLLTVLGLVTKLIVLIVGNGFIANNYIVFVRLTCGFDAH